MLKNKTINHPKLGGDVVDLRKSLPQRKPNSVMTGDELLQKVAKKTYGQQVKDAWSTLSKK